MFMRKKYEYNLFSSKLTTQLHNFVASAYTLIDTTDTFIKKFYKSNKLEYEFEIELNKLYKDPIFNLVYHIRRMFQHFTVPDIITDITHTPPSFTEIKLLLSKDEFYKFVPKKDDKGKPNSASEYLKNLKTDIELSSLISHYEKTIYIFYEWLYKKLNEYHQNDINIVNEKTKKIRQSFIPQSIAGHIQIYKLGQMNPESIFAGLINPESFKKITESQEFTNKEKLQAYLAEMKDIELGNDIILELVQIFK